MTAASFLAHLLAVLALACITYAAGKGVVVLVEFYGRRAPGRTSWWKRVSPPRWWREWREPALKCERVGHRMVRQRRPVIAHSRSGDFRAVAVYVDHERVRCSRCRLVEEEEHEVGGRRSIQSLSLSGDLRRQFDRDGFLPEGPWETVARIEPPEPWPTESVAERRARGRKA